MQITTVITLEAKKALGIKLNLNFADLKISEFSKL